VLNLVLLTQYFDTLKEIGVSSGSKVILLPQRPRRHERHLRPTS